MIKLNNNYKQIINQAQETANKLQENLDSKEIFIYLENYVALCFIYYLNKGKEICDDNLLCNTYLNDITEKIQQQINKTRLDIFINEKRTLGKILTESYTQSIKILSKFFLSDYYQKISSQPPSFINEDKGEDISLICSFFEEENIEMKYLFLDLIKNKRIFNHKDTTVFNNDGITLFNFEKGISNLFIRKNYPNIATLDTYVHEIGHVWDYYNLQKENSSLDSSLYSAISNYTEVISTRNDLKFYEFLIKNNIRKDDALLELANLFYYYSNNLFNISILSQLDDEHIALLANNKEEIYNNSHMKNINEHLAKLNINFEEDLNYTYGILLGCYFLNNDDKYLAFLKMRNNYSSIFNLEKEKINSIDKVFTKTMYNYFKEYI